jgi:hypothetical protein
LPWYENLKTSPDPVFRPQRPGLVFGWITADEWYAQKPAFVAGLEQRQQRFVLPIPRNFHGWLFWPGPTCRTRYAAKPVQTLCRFSRPMMCQRFTRLHIKDTHKGALVWEVKAAPFWLARDGQILGPYWLIYARDVLDPSEEKYFLCNASPGTPLEAILHVAFARWPIERCFEDAKSELGLSHFEVRKYQALQRHLLLTQVSLLFLARQTDRLRGGKSGDHPVPGSHGRRRPDRRAVAAPTPAA